MDYWGTDEATAKVRKHLGCHTNWVEENLALLGAGRGYILAPCHNIQAISPAENVVAMYETAYALGWA